MPDILRSETLDQISEVAMLTIRLTTSAEISFTLTKSTGLVVSSVLPALNNLPLDELLKDFQYTSDWLGLSRTALGIPWGSFGDIRCLARDDIAPNRELIIRQGATTLRHYFYDRTTKFFSAAARPAFSLTPIEFYYWLRMGLTEMAILAQI